MKICWLFRVWLRGNVPQPPMYNDSEQVWLTSEMFLLALLTKSSIIAKLMKVGIRSYQKGWFVLFCLSKIKRERECKPLIKELGRGNLIVACPSNYPTTSQGAHCYKTSVKSSKLGTLSEKLTICQTQPNTSVNHNYLNNLLIEMCPCDAFQK